MNFTPEILRTLEESLLFAHVPPSVLLGHLDRFELRALTAGQLFLLSGEVGDRVHIVANGRLRIHLSPGDEPVEMLGEGESLGEMSLITDHTLPYFVTADTDCTIVSIDHRTMWSMIESSHQVARNLLNILMHHPVNNNFNSESDEFSSGYVGMNHVDELTGLYNKYWMQEIFQRQIHRSARDNSNATLLLVCVEGMERYNTEHGRLGGDQALRTVAQTILSCLRPHDIAARYSGSKFAVFLPRTNLEEATKAAKRLQKHLDEANIVTPSGDALPRIGASLRLSEVLGDEPLDHLLTRTNTEPV
ncbi:MAG: GGDEF domain-containing protein [Pseudomonadota bacterium]